MSTSTFIAQILALSYIAIGLGALFNKKYFEKIFDSITKNVGLTMLFGILTLVVGYVIVFKHNIWVWNWTLLITLVGWAALIKGALLLVFPNFLFKQSKTILKGKIAKILPYTCIIVGLIFAYFGFF